jgi:hypothetical protein
VDGATSDRFVVLKLKGVEPEMFLLLIGRSRAGETGFFWTTSLELAERELRDELAQMGRSITESDVLVAKARANPV